MTECGHHRLIQLPGANEWLCADCPARFAEPRPVHLDGVFVSDVPFTQSFEGPWA